MRCCREMRRKSRCFWTAFQRGVWHNRVTLLVIHLFSDVLSIECVVQGRSCSLLRALRIIARGRSWSLTAACRPTFLAGHERRQTPSLFKNACDDVRVSLHLCPALMAMPPRASRIECDTLVISGSREVHFDVRMPQCQSRRLQSNVGVAGFELRDT